MYQCKFAIKIFGSDQGASSHFQKVEPQESFEYFPVVLAGIRCLCKKCFTDFGGLPNRLTVWLKRYDSLPDIWAVPLSLQLVSFSVNRISGQIKSGKNVFLALTYLHAVMDNIPDLVWFRDICGLRLKINSTFLNAVGKSGKEVDRYWYTFIRDIEPDEYASGENICLGSGGMVLPVRKICVFDEKVKSGQGMRQFKTYQPPSFR